MNDLHPLDRKLFEIKKFCYVLESLLDYVFEEMQDEEDVGNEADFENSISGQEAFRDFLTHLYNSLNVIQGLSYFEAQDLQIEVNEIDVDTSTTTIKFYALKYNSLKKLLNELIYICDLYYSDYQVTDWKGTFLQVLDDLKYYDDYMAEHI